MTTRPEGTPVRQVRPKTEGWQQKKDADGKPLLQFASPKRGKPPVHLADLTPDERVALVREAMLAGRMSEAATLLPPALVDQYGVAGTPEECAAAIGAQRANFDLFMLPMNDEATCEAHIDTCAGILNS